MSRNRFGSFIGTVIYLVIFIFSGLFVQDQIKQEGLLEDKQATIGVGEFQGRILPSEEVSPGTFTVQRPWEDVVSQWGENAILTANITSGDNPKILLRAWRPDPNTQGVFEYASHILEAEEVWGKPESPHHVYLPRHAFVKDGQITIIPRQTMKAWPAVPIIFVAILAFVGMIVCGIFLFSRTK